MDESCRNLLKPALKIPQEQGFSLSKNENKKNANRKRQEGLNKGKILLLSQHETTIIILKSPPYRTENIKIFSQIVLA